MEGGKFRNIGELIGLIAIVASLVFVGLQLQQSQEIAIAGQYQNRADAAQNMVLTHLEAGHVQRNFRDHLSDSVSAADINLFHWLWLSQDNHFYQYMAGFLDEESWEAQLRNIKDIYAICDMRFVWNWRKTGLRGDFVAFVEALEDPCKTSEN